MNQLPLQCRIMRQTLSNLTPLPHRIQTAVPNWFRRRSFAGLNRQLGSAHEWSGVWTGPKTPDKYLVVSGTIWEWSYQDGHLKFLDFRAEMKQLIDSGTLRRKNGVARGGVCTHVIGFAFVIWQSSKCRSIIVFTFQDCNENANTSKKIFSLFISMGKKK